MASKWYGKGLLKVMNGSIDLLNDTIKVILVTSSYTYDADHDFANDVSGNELSVSGYTGGFGGAGRKTLANKSMADDTTNNRIEFDADDLTWTALGAGQTLGGAVLVKEITNDAASEIIAFLDPSDLVLNGSDVTFVWNAETLLQNSYA
jgi:hypothetical protein